MNNMTPELQVAVVQLVAKVGITAATTLLEGIKAARTIVTGKQIGRAHV